MELIRFIHSKNFDHVRGRFNDLCFKNLRGALSVVHRECVDATGATICAHARRYYSSIAGEPPIFLLVRAEALPAPNQIEQSPSLSGDECHHDVKGISDNRLKKFFKALDWREFFICENGAHRPLTQADIDRFLA